MIELIVVSIIASLVASYMTVSNYMTLMKHRYGRLKALDYTNLIRKESYYIAMLGLNIVTFLIVFTIYTFLLFILKESLSFIAFFTCAILICIANYVYGPRYYLAGYLNETVDQAAQSLLIFDEVIYHDEGWYETVDKNVITKSSKKETQDKKGERNGPKKLQNIIIPRRTRWDDGRIH